MEEKRKNRFFNLRSLDNYTRGEMPRKNAMRDNVNAVRMRLPHLSNFSREQIELALLYYESNIDQTVDAFNRSTTMEILHLLCKENFFIFFCFSSRWST